MTKLHPFQQGDTVELEIIDLNHEGSGVGKIDRHVIFVNDTVVGDRLLVRIVRINKKYSEGKIQEMLTPSPHGIRPRCIVADRCGGCQWQHIDYQFQLETKRNLAIQTLQRIGGFENPPVLEIIPSEDLGYRNKSTYPLGISEVGKVQAGFYRKNSHKIVNINQCPIQDQRLNPILAQVKQDLQDLDIPIYNEKTKKGALRHLCLNIGVNSGEILITLVSKETDLPKLEAQANIWLKRYENVVGVTLNHNPKPNNVIFGENTLLLAGKPYLKEIFAGLTFYLTSETFFQVNTPVTETLLNFIFSQLNLQGNEIFIDAYCGIGTFTLPFAQKVSKAIGIEIQKASIEQAMINADNNDIDNVEFLQGQVEKILPQLTEKTDVILLDPPRKGCHREVIDTLLEIKPSHIVYLSCKIATLARDLKLLCEGGVYELTLVQPADFFPQTPHVECVAFLQIVNSE